MDIPLCSILISNQRLDSTLLCDTQDGDGSCMSQAIVNSHAHFIWMDTYVSTD